MLESGRVLDETTLCATTREPSAMKLRSALRKRKRLWLLLTPVLAAGVWFGLEVVSYAAYLRVYSIPTASMSPTLTPGDRIAVETRPGLIPKRGELWVFTMPGAGTAVKRVIGLPGETVQVSGGRVLIDDRPLVEPYPVGTPTYETTPLRLLDGQYYMMGDNRDASHDSHVWGPLDAASLIGRADYRYWPASRAGELK